MKRHLTSVILLFACGATQDSRPGDDGPPGYPVDSGFLDDAGEPADAGAEADAGVRADAGAVTDAGGRADAGTVRDAGGPGVCDPYAPRSPAPQLLIGPNGLQTALLARMNAATTSLSLAIYQITLDSFANALIAAHRRGVRVQVVIDCAQTPNERVRQNLGSAGVPLRCAPSAFDNYHPKFFIVDGREAVVMSANLIAYSMGSERNYGVIDTDPDDIADLQAIFDADWAGTGTTPDISCTRLVVSPVNSKARLLALVNGARRKLDLAVMYLSERDIAQAVKARAQAGVAVRVLLADPNWISSNRQTATDLTALGIPVKFLETLELHAKLVISDDTAFVGSENLSWTSLAKNREVGVFVTEVVPQAAIAQQFDADWLAGRTP